MKGKIKRKHPAFWLIRHRSGNIRDHPQRYHVNVGKKYGNFRISNSYHNEIMKKEEYGDFRYNKKINGIDYVRRRIPYYVRKKDAEEEADAYRFFGIDAKVVPIKEKGKTFYSVYVPKKDVDWINKHMIEDYHVTEWESGHYRGAFTSHSSKTRKNEHISKGLKPIPRLKIPSGWKRMTVDVPEGSLCYGKVLPDGCWHSVVIMPDDNGTYFVSYGFPSFMLPKKFVYNLRTPDDAKRVAIRFMEDVNRGKYDVYEDMYGCNKFEGDKS